MDAMTEIRLTFFEECDEQLVALDRGLHELATGTGDGETIGVVYRAVHSIKGGAASFDLHELSRFAKMFEGVLAEIRAERLVPSADTHALLAAARAALGHLVEVARSRDAVFAELRALVPGAENETATPEAAAAEPAGGEVLDLSEFGFTPVSVDFGDVDLGPRDYRIVFRPRAELYANANESARLIREVLSLGEGRVEVDCGEVPLLGDLDAEGAYLAWTITLSTDRGEAAIREIFDFAEFDCDLEITRIEADEPDDGDPMAGLDPEVAALFARLQAQA